MTASGWRKYLGRVVVMVGLLGAVPFEIIGASAPAQWAIIVYVSGEVDLQPVAERYWQCLENARLSDEIIVVAEFVARDGGDGGEVWGQRCWYGKAGRQDCQSEQLTGLSQAARIANLIKWAIHRAPAKRYALVVVGHGRVAPTLVTEGNGEEPTSLSSPELRAALAQGLADNSREKLDVLFLDCCFGATVEVAAELKDMVGYLVGTPGLMYSPGLPWDEILRWLSAHPDADAQALVQQAVASLGSLWEQEPELPVSLIAIDASRAEAVQRRVRVLAVVARERMPTTVPEITLARSRAESWGSRGELVDLGGFAAALGTISAFGTVAQRAQQLSRAIERAVVARYVQGPLAPGQVRHQGLAVFFPLGREQWPESYQEAYEGGFAKCWGPFLNAYLRGLHGRLAEDGVPDRRAG